MQSRRADPGPADLAREFERYRPHLTEVAYRMLGTLTDAEDAVQEAYLRLTRARRSEPRDVRAWLTTVVARICLDELGSARARRESYVGQWLPEPLVGASPAPGPEDRVTLDESVSMAVLVLLESLSPAERTAFVLRDVFGLSYPEVARTVGRSEAACRQLVARARGHVRARAPRFTPDQGQHADAVEAFAQACFHGGVEDLVRVLDPKVVLRSDGGGLVPGVARRPVTGALNVARLLLGVTARRAVTPRPSTVNGSPGLVFEAGGAVVGVMGFTVAGTLITELDLVVNPDKLRRVRHN
ncbi:RNA polymerase sigma-70 factor (ECF subfamily) [Nonomuraea thailandensis]|uniref:RNA polymerase sigma-70 factor (ECF subfamily) n=1 Tax=Nonomuraea thailandensis TaxID=1188745 RepID=A0A9X2GB80_9ACTN|nr:RNA polymerase sigma factor SigJ [Nonomuraea thailandensis]MCP2355761.1 RNA polymerase sigma-70 factor (ECF subfamily) [Nonomuraea thailandensis]